MRGPFPPKMRFETKMSVAPLEISLNNFELAAFRILPPMAMKYMDLTSTGIV